MSDVPRAAETLGENMHERGVTLSMVARARLCLVGTPLTPDQRNRQPGGFVTSCMESSLLRPD